MLKFFLIKFPVFIEFKSNFAKLFLRELTVFKIFKHYNFRIILLRVDFSEAFSALLSIFKDLKFYKFKNSYFTQRNLDLYFYEKIKLLDKLWY